MILAHRVSFELAGGVFTPGQCCLHRCDTPQCVNPAHLFAGSRQDNVTDMHAKGRARKRGLRGEEANGAKLTEIDVRLIRDEYALGTVSQPVLARRFGMTQAGIWRLLHRKTWPHVS